MIDRQARERSRGAGIRRKTMVMRLLTLSLYLMSSGWALAMARRLVRVAAK